MLPPWEEAVFADCERAATSGQDAWDAKRYHQHLTPSPSGRSVATTGVAGYGAALAARRPKKGAQQRWEVRAVRFGVGGFGVGVERAAMKPPYKSLGKGGDALAFFHSGGGLASAGRPERPFGPAFEPGDRIGLELRAVGGAKKKREAAFSLNGEEVGVAPLDGVGASEELVLAVQPYMGGVATLLS